MTVVISVIVIVAVIIVAIFGYQQYQERDALKNVQFSVSDARIESLNVSTASLNLTLKATNAGTSQATIDRTNYTVFINNVTLGTGQNDHKVTIPAGATVYIPQPLEVSNSGAAQSAWAYLTQDQVDWRLVGTAYYDTILGTVSAGYEYNGTSPGA